MNAKVAYLNASLSCEQCHARSFCLSGRCAVAGHGALSGEIKVKGPYHCGDYVFHAGQAAHSVYFIRDGVVKCERVSSTGGVHVAGFYLQGEMFGSEDIGTSLHCYDAIALEESWICEISVERLEQLFHSSPDLQHRFLTSVSERLRGSEKVITDSFHLRAKQRLIGFLCDFYYRSLQRKPQVGRSILLPMNKGDIANHLGISAETLSRLLRELEDEKQIRNGIRQIELLDPERIACPNNA